MTHLAVSLATYLFVLSLAYPARACPVFATAEAIVATGLSSIPTPMQVTCFEGEDGTTCQAGLMLTLSSLPSRSLVPRPRDLAEPLAAAAQAFAAKTCTISVWVRDDLDPEADDYAEQSCRRAEFRYDGGSWSAIGDEEPCFSAD